MTLRQQWMIVLGIVAVLAVGVTFVLHEWGDQFFPVSVGSQAPQFRATVVQEKAALMPKSVEQRSLDDYRGSVVLLNVWATFCQPCEVEMPAIEKLHQELGPKGLKVVAVSVDERGAALDAAIRSYITRHGLTFDVLHDTTFDIEKAYQTTGYPETFIIGRDGVIRKKIIGAHDWSSPADRVLVSELLAEPAR